MKIKFAGAVGKVTGSCTWCIHPQTGAQFLVDCGAVQGGMNQEAENHMPFPFRPSDLKFILLTHAHMDHCGRIPQLYYQGFRGKVICTAATAQLAKLQLNDAHLQAKKQGKYTKEDEICFPVHPGVVLSPRPHRNWFYPIDERRRNFEFGKPLPIDDDLFVAFRRSSHMLGCCSITVMWSSTTNFRKSICFSGDIGPIGKENRQSMMMNRNQVPHPQSPYLVVESTYGGKPPKKDEHKNVASRWGNLRTIISRYRTIIIPCFSLQRTQEILLDLWRALHDPSGKREIPELDVVLDSSLAKNACRIFREEIKKNGNRYLNLEDNIRVATPKQIDEALCGPSRTEPDGRQWIFHGKIQSSQKSENARGGVIFDPSDGKKRVVVTSSGMCHAGPVLGYLRLLEEPDTAFVITGFQNTPNGRRLQELAKKQADAEEKWDKENGEPVSLFINDRESKEEKFLVRAGVFDFAPYYSGHADIDVLLEYILDLDVDARDARPEDDWKPEDLPFVTVFLNHGDNLSRSKLRKRILNKCSGENSSRNRKVSKVEIPHMTSPFFDLERGKWEERPLDLVRQLVKTLAQRDNAARSNSKRRSTEAKKIQK